MFTRGSEDVPGEIRTPDPQLRRLLLYPAELLGHMYGAGEGNRTLDISLEGWSFTIKLHPHDDINYIHALL